MLSFVNAHGTTLPYSRSRTTTVRRSGQYGSVVPSASPRGGRPGRGRGVRRRGSGPEGLYRAGGAGSGAQLPRSGQQARHTKDRYPLPVAGNGPYAVTR